MAASGSMRSYKCFDSNVCFQKEYALIMHFNCVRQRRLRPPATSVRKPQHSPFRLQLIHRINCLTSSPRQAHNLKVRGSNPLPETKTPRQISNTWRHKGRFLRSRPFYRVATLKTPATKQSEVKQNPPSSGRFFRRKLNHGIQRIFQSDLQINRQPVEPGIFNQRNCGWQVLEADILTSTELFRQFRMPDQADVSIRPKE